LQKGMLAAELHCGEIGGHKVKFVKLDDASNPSTATLNARKLVEEFNADVILGAAGAPMTLAIAAVSRERKVPFIALSPIPVAKDQGEWLVVVTQPASLMVEADVADMKKAGVKTVAFIGFNDAWGDQVYDALVAAAARSEIKVLTNERYARTDTSVTAQALKMLALKPDAVLSGGAGSAGALPHLVLSERGFKGRAYTTHANINTDFLRTGGRAIEGVIAPTGPIVVAEQMPEENPIRAMGLAYRDEYKLANDAEATDAIGPYAYDGMLLFADAAKRALRRARPGTSEFRAALRDEIQSTRNLVGTHGVYSFSPGSPSGVDERARVLVHMQKGKWQLVKE
jgi:branched-chain amino acid transport system substrate-binding protein